MTASPRGAPTAVAATRYVFSARPGDSAGGGVANERDPDELQHSRRAPCSEVCAKTALGAAPHVVCQPERRDGGDGRVSPEGNRPPDQGEAVAAGVCGP